MKTLKFLSSKKCVILVALFFSSIAAEAQDATVNPKSRKLKWGFTMQTELKKANVFENKDFRNQEPILRDRAIHLGASARLKLNKRISLSSGLTLGYRKATNTFFYFPGFNNGLGYGCYFETPEINSESEQIEFRVPIAAQFYIVPERLSFNIGGSFSKSIISKETSYYYINYSEERPIGKETSNRMFGNSNLGLNIGIAYQFKMQNDNFIQIEPTLILNTGVRNNQYSAGLWGLNVSYWF